jgi:carboxymethylenebutenolidase
MTMFTEQITFPSNGSTAPGYLAHDESSEPRPGIVVIQEWWGLDAHIQDVTRRVAGAGYVALAPDLYHGAVATEPDEARKLAMEMEYGQALKDIAGAVQYLKALDFVNPKSIGVVGFCMGGGLALMSAAHNPDVGAVVAFYGRAPKADEFGDSTAAILQLVGEKDEDVLATARALDTGLRMQPVTHELVVYPGAGHAFFNDTRPHIYEPGAAHDAWGRAMQWFKAHLV